MPRELQIFVLPEDLHDESAIKKIISRESGIPIAEIQVVKTERKSIDARSRTIKFQLKVKVFLKGELPEEKKFEFKGQLVKDARPVFIGGAGPGGLFAALKLIELGLKPIVLERGKNVRDRRRDLAVLNRDHIVNPESNYCFGEGGAGTYSDGKLYTRSTKRGDVNYVLEMLVAHGASEEILVDAHPHIGTNKLPDIIVDIRNTIIEFGGEVRFDSKITDIHFENGKFTGLTVNENEKLKGDQFILATGHSARDIFYLLQQRNILIEYKPFAIGVRAEHPQELIDKIQYKCDVRNPLLPPASYSLVEQVKGLGVYSFCMCPGGIIAPCATAPGEIVTNGWSPSKRNNPFANSGIVVTIDESELVKYADFGALAGLKFQEQVEQTCWNYGGKTQTAPAQRMGDFVHGKISSSLPACSYQPGILSVNLHEALPESIALRLKEGFKAFGNKMKGYFTNEAVLVAPESRTSSPVRIPRDKDSLEHPQIKGFYPCGEGAGYAGGIVSAAMDGIRCAEMCAKN